jgi:hypothetical protein
VVLTGLAMTHEEFFASERGYIADDAPIRAFLRAIELGVRDFVIPGTVRRKEVAAQLKALLDDRLGEGNYSLSAPGFVSQGGEISEMGQMAGPIWYAIVGSGIYKKPVEGITNPKKRINAMRAAALKQVGQLG